VVHRVITDLGVFDVAASDFEVVELADEVSREQVLKKTEAALRFRNVKN
jgi:acyl CoA:acetate/3-ketoacid CoA transferase beta subunit